MEKYKIMTWDEFRSLCQEDAELWHNQGYHAEELSADDILNEYPDDYFSDDYDDDLDDLSHCFTPEEIANKTLEYLAEME